ncbi:MAG: YebC/PmpR family DNA-binding transcriptional regulator [Patescibacteria group bacterium]
MSGHSKWSTIKRKKEVRDAKRGQVFTKIGKIISVAAHEAGPDPNTNFKLRLAVDQARRVNMPAENIERAILRGAGKTEGVRIEQLTYEAYGPSGVALMIEVVTDNKNRTLNELRHILQDNGGRLASQGSVGWMFEKTGVIRILLAGLKKEEIELQAIDLGALDIKEEGDVLAIFCEPKKLGGLKKSLEQKGIKIQSQDIELKTKNPIKISDKNLLSKIEKLMEALDEHDDVNEIYSNIKD